MKLTLASVLGVLSILSALLGSTGEASNSELSFTSLIGNGLDFNSLNQAPARRSLLSHSNEHDTALVAALDGTIHLVELKSLKILWSFSSGPPIYSSYQAPVNHDNDKENASGLGGGFFVDCGDDWKLFAHTELGEVKLDITAEKYLSTTPFIAEDGGVVIGSKKSTVFLVDAKTGRLIYTYGLLDSPPINQSNEGLSGVFNKPIQEKSDSVDQKTDDVSLYITRTDYLLESFAPNSDKVLWNMTVSEIGAAFLCQDENSFSRDPLNSGHELPSEPDLHFNMPLPCQSKAVVFRLRSQSMLESFSRLDGLPEGHNEDMSLPVLPPNYMLPSEAESDNLLEYNDNNGSEVMLSFPRLTKSSGFSVKSSALFFVPFLLFAVGSFTYLYAALARKQVELIKQPFNLNDKAVPSKRKKIRKSGKSNGIVEEKGKDNKSDFEDGYARIESDNKVLLNLNKLNDGARDGRIVGKLFVSNTEIAKGSNGTIILEGIHEGRPVAVKRLVKAHHDVAFKEIQNLIASDRHPNIVRWYGVEYDQDFVYLSLERCTCSLNDLIQMYSDSSERSGSDSSTKAMTGYKVRFESIKDIMQDIKLWKANGYPSPILLKLMRDVISGLVHLHELGIIHRDLKPQNVLIIKERSLCAKLSDMGISKRLVGDMSSLGHHATGYGSSGWQAPEQLLHGRQTRAVDLFSLGCVLFFCITGGRHPFGDHLERDINIAKNKVDLFLVEYIPEAMDLFSRLLNPHAEFRPKASKVLHHPLFWSSEMRLSFLRDTSDRVELEDREIDSNILKALESVAAVALGGKWDEKMEPAFIANIGRYRRYQFESVRDLLRVMRNKLNHYRELPKEIQELLGSVPEGFDGYFANRFPKLLIEVYNLAYKYCREEEWFQKFCNSNVI